MEEGGFPAVAVREEEEEEDEEREAEDGGEVGALALINTTACELQGAP